MATSKGVLGTFGFLVLLAFLTWPPILVHFLSLDWYVGDMRPAAWSVEVVLLCSAILVFVFRRWLSKQYRRLLPSRKRALFAAITVLLSAAASLAGAEAALRMMHRPFRKVYTPSENAIARFDPVLGWTYIPNTSTTRPFGSDERDIPIEIGELGTRVRYAGQKHDPFLPTVLFVGCSFTWGHGVTYEESFPGQIEINPAFPLQVLNLGVQGYGTDQSLLWLKQLMPRFNVKAVVYTFICDQVRRNAVADRRVLIPGAEFIGTKPKFGLRFDGSLFQSDRPQLYQDYAYSRLWAYIQVQRFRRGPRPSLDLTRALVREMEHYVKENGAQFLLIWWNDDADCSVNPFSGMNLNILDIAESAPSGWQAWKIPGDTHPDPRTHHFVAERLLERWQGLGTVAAPPPALSKHREDR